ncbi:hypothetical protein C2E23DRAFT_817757 [Lenzites betulinus]|nr:hypothetical protein C2E23DRAFT_817757 [Lenzites betulinus]
MHHDLTCDVHLRASNLPGLHEVKAHTHRQHLPHLEDAGGVCTGAPTASVLLIETGPGESGAGAKEGTAPGAELGSPRRLRKDPGQLGKGSQLPPADKVTHAVDGGGSMCAAAARIGVRYRWLTASFVATVGVVGTPGRVPPAASERISLPQQILDCE